MAIGLKPGWSLLFSSLTIVGFGIAIFSIRPIVMPSLVAPPTNAPLYYVRFLIANNGHLPMNNIEVICTAEKAVFANRYTFLINRTIIWKMQAVENLADGASFNTFCTQPWFLYMRPSDGFLSFGAAEPLGEMSPVLPFDFVDDPEHPHAVLRSTRFLEGNKGFRASVGGYVSYPLTALDMRMEIKYTVFGIKRVVVVHFVGRGVGTFTWDIEPEGQGVPPDGVGGFTLKSSGNLLVLGIPQEVQ